MKSEEVGQVGPAVVDVDRARIEHAARARRDGDLVETLSDCILRLQDEVIVLRAALSAKTAELAASRAGAGQVDGAP